MNLSQTQFSVNAWRSSQRPARAGYTVSLLAQTRNWPPFSVSVPCVRHRFATGKETQFAADRRAGEEPLLQLLTPVILPSHRDEKVPVQRGRAQRGGLTSAVFALSVVCM